MKVTLAVPYPMDAAGDDRHLPDETIEVPDDVGADLIRDGWARVPDATKDSAEADVPVVDVTKNEPAGPPPKTGEGSTVDAWGDYARSHGITVADDAKRADIIAALTAANIPVD